MSIFSQRIPISLLALAVLCSGLALAQSSPAPGSEAKPKAGVSGAADQSFIRKAAQGGLAEVELGNLAEQNARSEQVKQFGQRMVTDHSKAGDTLKQIADRKGVNVPQQINASDRQEKARLEKLKGAQFDHAYISYMVKDHQKDVAEFRKTAQTAKDPDVKAFAQQTLPTLEEHLKLAQQIQKSLGANARSSATRTTAGAY